MDKTAILGIVRHILTTLGGILVTKGYVDASGIEAIAGGVVAVVGVVWSVLEKRARA